MLACFVGCLWQAFSETVKVLCMDRLAFDELIVPLEVRGKSRCTP